MIPHPIPYQGSKRNLAAAILKFFPDHVTRLIEPFAGSAAISLAALYSGRVSSVIVSDVDAALMRLWLEIRDRPESLANAYKSLWVEQTGRERDYYNHIRSEFNQFYQPHHFLYLLARCVKAAVRYNANGEFNQSPDNRRRGAHPQTVGAHLLAASQLLANRSLLVCQDYRETLDLASSADVVYLDPPYQGVCQKRDSRYNSKVTFGDFVNSLERLNSRRISFIVSYDGKTGAKSHGNLLPATDLNLVHLEMPAGRSAQATLLGRKESTIESLYLSSALIERIGPHRFEAQSITRAVQYDMFATLVNT